MQLWLSEAVEVEVTAKKETGADFFVLGFNAGGELSGTFATLHFCL